MIKFIQKIKDKLIIIRTNLRNKKIERMHNKFSKVVNKGERILGTENDDNGNTHKKRYEFASNFLKDSKSVLDYACGTGYGSRILSRLNSKIYITAFDIDLDALEYAKKNWNSKNINFTNNINNKNYDTVISFEFLEHVDNLHTTLNDLLLLTTKRLIFSVPYKEKLGNNPHHKHFNLSEKDFSIYLNLKIFFQNKIGNITKHCDEVDKQNIIIIIEKN